MIDLRRFPAYFFRSESGNTPVLDWLRGLPKRERIAVGLDLQRLEYRWPIGMPHARSFGGFIKKTQTTPRDEIIRARARKQEWENRDGYLRSDEEADGK